MEEKKTAAKKAPKKKAPTKGVLLVAFGKRGYAFAAVNLACSIKKHNPEIKIHLVADPDTMRQVPANIEEAFIDSIEKVEGLFDGEPGRTKFKALLRSPFDQTLYLDVDAMAFKDISPIFDKFQGRAFVCQGMGTGKVGDKDISYDAWADEGHEYSAARFGLQAGDLWRTCQTSFLYYEKGSTSKKIIEKVIQEIDKGYDKSKLRFTWGGFLPDELFLSAVLSKIGKDEHFNNPEDIIYFASTYEAPSIVIDKAFILSLYGPGGGSSLVRPIWFEYYDRVMIKNYEAFGLDFFFKHNLIMSDKILTRGSI